MGNDAQPRAADIALIECALVHEPDPAGDARMAEMEGISRRRDGPREGTAWEIDP
jgi:hypothetical protein